VRPASIRVRLVAGFVLTMLVVLTAAGGFVYWRVQVALDSSLDGQLQTQAADLRRTVAAHPDDPAGAIAALATGEQLEQLVRPDGTVAAAASGVSGRVLLRPRDLAAARTSTVQADLGQLLTGGDRRLRVLAFPAPPGVAVTAVRIAQRDEALRELLAQLALANVAALAIAAVVGYRLARAALAPVDRYRARAEQIAEGDQGVRLDVPAAPDDEVTRLGHTLNDMLAAQAAAAERQRRFVADASHELRTPLSLLTTEVELALRRPRTNDEYEQTLRDVAADTARLSRLAEQLLALEAMPPAGGSADLAEAARRAARRGSAQESDVQADALRPVPVAADDQQLDLLLGNLVDNAVRHGGGSAATVRARQESGCGIATVSDGGPGMPSAFVPQAVERFRRADEARTTVGSGLGLALVHDLAVRLGGELRLCALGAHHTYPPARFPDAVCDHPPGGTSVSLVLPAAAG